MKKFLIGILLFSVIVIALFAFPVFCLPNKQFDQSILAAIPDKHTMLEHTAAPRIIFVGGSSVSMGINSQKVSAYFHIPVINDATALWPGLKFMVNDLKPYIRKNDIIVLSPEYNCFDMSNNQCGFEGYEGLIAIVCNIVPQEKNLIDLKQWMHLLAYVPHYAASQVNNEVIHGGNVNTVGLGRHDYNSYGDLYVHWNWAKVPFKAEEKCTGDEKVNADAINFLCDFNQYIHSKQATLFILPPPLQDTSFFNQQYIINKIITQFKERRLPLIASPERYMLEDKYFNDLEYHLTKAGVDRRTDMVIQDLARVIDTAKLHIAE
jgi:hypothetical protein